MSDSKRGFSFRLRKNLWVFLVLVAVGIAAVSSFLNRRSDFTDLVSERTSSIIAKRMAALNSYMKFVGESGQGWPELKNFPEDMVIYHYKDDSLRSWYNQFSLDNDDISRRTYVQRFVNLRFNVVSPLAGIDTVASYMNIGPKWYLVKRVDVGRNETLIGGLEIRNTMEPRHRNGVSRHLRVSDRFSLYPISYSGGIPIYVEGRPLIKIIQENTGVAPLIPEPIYLWITFFLILSGIFSYIYNHRKLKAAGFSIAALTLVTGSAFLIGRELQTVSDMFSPSVYAQGPFLYSLAALILVNLWIFLTATIVYFIRKDIYRAIEKGNKELRAGLFGAIVIILTAGLGLYVHLTFKGLIMNSNITLEIYKISGINRYSIYVYLSYLALLLTFLLLLQLIRPVLKKYYGLRYDVFSRTNRIIFSIIAAVYLLAMSSILGFKKEANRVDIWANRLAVDRNLGFELQLRKIEMAIAGDPVIPLLIPENDDYRMVLNRITESYLSRVSQEFETVLFMFRDDSPVTKSLRNFFDRMENGTAIADSSRFKYSRSTGGRARYTGLFSFYNKFTGRTTSLFIGIDSKLDKEGTGYSAIIGDSGAGSVVVPQRYSYAKYLSGNLISYRGSYPYPTVFSGKLKEINDDSKEETVSIDKYVHFVTKISEDESIVISRRKVDFLRYMVAGFLILLLAFFDFSIPVLKRSSRKVFESNYYKTRINTVLYFSLFATLIAMAAISVLFVYTRNESNIMNQMTAKISSIQAMIEAKSRYFSSYSDFDGAEFSGVIDEIGSYTKSDISLYMPDGRVMKSTSPDVFERMMLGTRLNEDAYRNIMHYNKRYFIHKEKFAGYSYYAMYAPVINSSGKKLVIICAPYTDSAIEFKYEAVFHAIFIITVFLILMVFTRVLSATVIDKMFRPLVEMGLKMHSARINGLEYIIYDREDEISSLVRSYNLMVHDLSESSKQAAQFERDKAWSQMARQVAHEIKNPLTPIKLQIQRIIRLKQKNDPKWEETLDSIIPIIMDSIDGLTETANEFSTFAKLYSETPVLINLDEMATKQVALFADRDNISIQYIGLQNSMVLGPKPQIARVFVNLLANAVQAVENQQREDVENGREPKQGLVNLSIRNSTKDGFYDVVVEDNGPGVKDENRHRLFTPNFTTKSSGTGLGLAICKNIIELCGGEIQYSRSFSLQGACFTFRIPKAV